MKNFIVSLSILAMFGCVPKEGPNCHTGVIFHNGTESALYVDFSIDYPDSIRGISSTNISSHNMLGAGESRKLTNYLSGRVECMEFRYSSFYKSYGSVDTLMFYVYDEKVLLSNDWSNTMVLQRYDLSLEDMRALDWTLSYPPDERMQDIKMWPPYGTN